MKKKWIIPTVIVMIIGIVAVICIVMGNKGKKPGSNPEPEIQIEQSSQQEHMQGSSEDDWGETPFEEEKDQSEKPQKGKTQPSDDEPVSEEETPQPNTEEGWGDIL